MLSQVYDSLTRQLENIAKHQMPVERAMSLVARLLTARNHTAAELQTELATIGPEDLRGWSSLLLEVRTRIIKVRFLECAQSQ